MQRQQKMQTDIDAQYWAISWKVLGNPSDIPTAEKPSSKRSSLL